MSVKYSPPENHYIQLDIAFATAYGTNESLLFAKLHRLQSEWQGHIDENGYKWVRLTLEEWAEELPFLASKTNRTIRRTIESCEEQNILLSTVFTGRSKWYRCNDDFISVQNGHMSKMDNKTVQNGQLPNSLPNSPSFSSFQEEKGTESAPPQNNDPSPKQQSQKDKTALLPESDYAKSLFDQTNIERQARGYNNVKYFPSLACKRKFEARCQYLNGNTANAIKRAHEKGIIAITGIVDFIAKYEPNGANKTNGQSHQSPSGNRKPKTAKHSPKTWTQRRAEAHSGS